VAYKEKEIEKLYYSIGEVAEMLQVNTSLIRYWEKEFDILKPKKNAKGDRFFTKEDIEKIRLIYRLVKDKGYTLDGAKTQLKSKYEEEQKKLRITEKLKKVRGFLVELREQLDTE
jgi:DNA-binding transcriptional MerR regulator